MVHMNLQFFGGRGSGGSTGSKNTGGKSTEEAGKGGEEFTFTPKDLKNSKKDWGGYNMYSETATNWGNELVKTLKPGDIVDITKTNKDGTVRKTSIEIVTPEDMDKQNAKSKWAHARNSKPQAERYKTELQEKSVVFARRTGQKLDDMQDFTPDRRISAHYGSDFTHLISMSRSKTKEVKISVRRKKNK